MAAWREHPQYSRVTPQTLPAINAELKPKNLNPRPYYRTQKQWALSGSMLRAAPRSPPEWKRWLEKLKWPALICGSLNWA